MIQWVYKLKQLIQTNTNTHVTKFNCFRMVNNMAFYWYCVYISIFEAPPKKICHSDHQLRGTRTEARTVRETQDLDPEKRVEFRCVWFGWYCWWFRNPANSPVEVGTLSHYLEGFIHPRWCRNLFISSITILHIWKQNWVLLSCKCSFFSNVDLTGICSTGVDTTNCSWLKKAEFFHHASGLFSWM